MARSSTSYGRFHVGESPSALRSLHFHQGGPLKEVDHEPKMGVLDQEDLFAQGIRVSTFIPGAQDVDALGSCTANATTVALSNVLDEAAFSQWVARPVPTGSIYEDTAAGERRAIRFYHECTDQTGQPSEEWPPTDCGSSGPYIVAELERQGVIAGAKIAAPNADSIVSLLQEGGLLMGSPWLNAWEEPSSDGFVDGDGSPSTLETQIRRGIAGGHETYVSAIEELTVLPTGQVDARNTVVRVRNSWDESWGAHGSCRFHLSTIVYIGSQCDFRLLLPKGA